MCKASIYDVCAVGHYGLQSGRRHRTGRGLNQRDDRCLVSVEFEIIGIGVRASSPNISHQNVGVRYPRGSVGKKYLEDLGFTKKIKKRLFLCGCGLRKPYNRTNVHTYKHTTEQTYVLQKYNRATVHRTTTQPFHYTARSHAPCNRACDRAIVDNYCTTVQPYKQTCYRATCATVLSYNRATVPCNRTAVQPCIRIIAAAVPPHREVVHWQALLALSGQSKEKRHERRNTGQNKTRHIVVRMVTSWYGGIKYCDQVVNTRYNKM
jgi:hypothetical protein